MGCRSHGCSDRHKINILELKCSVSVFTCLHAAFCSTSLVTLDPIQCRECAFNSSLERTAPSKLGVKPSLLGSCLIDVPYLVWEQSCRVLWNCCVTKEDWSLGTVHLKLRS